MGSWAGRYGLSAEPNAGARFYWNDEADTIGSTPASRDNTVLRYHDAPRRDFKARMDWCVKSFAEANHPPVPTLTVNGQSVTMGILRLDAKPGDTIRLQAAATDPDHDAVQFDYVYYREAGTYRGPIGIKQDKTGTGEFTIPADAAGTEIHIYLDATDNGSARGSNLPDLTRYCRLIVRVCAP
jgi:hypothetical protein